MQETNITMTEINTFNDFQQPLCELDELSVGSFEGETQEWKEDEEETREEQEEDEELAREIANWKEWENSEEKKADDERVYVNDMEIKYGVEWWWYVDEVDNCAIVEKYREWACEDLRRRYPEEFDQQEDDEDEEREREYDDDDDDNYPY